MALETYTPTVHITTDSSSSPSTSAFHPPTPTAPQLLSPTVALHYLFATPAALDIASNADLAQHAATAAAGPPYDLFPAVGGSAGAILDFGPNPDLEEGFWHRTQTVDYIVVLEGELELEVDGAEGGGKRVLRAGDVVVQRAPMHRWRNVGRERGAKSFAVCIGLQGAVQGGMEFKQ